MFCVLEIWRIYRGLRIVFARLPPPWLGCLAQGFPKASEDQKFKLVGFGLMVLLKIV